MDDQERFAPELLLTDEDRANLASVLASPGFAVIQRLFRSSIDAFAVAMINAPLRSIEAEQLHMSAKSAAQLYAQFIERVTSEVQLYVRAPRPTDKPIDSAEALDMGGLSYEDTQNFLDNPAIWDEL